MKTAPTAEFRRAEKRHGYAAFEELIRRRVAEARGPLFTTGATCLFTRFINCLPDSQQHYRCNACQRFIEKYGGLVTIDEMGVQHPVLWSAPSSKNSHTPAFFFSAVAVLFAAVKKAQVTGVFLSSDAVWGTPTTGIWTHLSGRPDASLVFSHPLKSASQMMAEKLEDFGMLERSLQDFSLGNVEMLLSLINMRTLFRGEHITGIAKWFHAIHKLHANLPSDSPRRTNLLWRAVATAPVGFCHVRGSMIGTVLQDIKDGLTMGAVEKRFAEKMHPGQYQRPTTVKAGTIVRAEEIVGRLNSAGALQRRFARLEEVQAIWRPRFEQPASLQEESATVGVFAGVKPTKPAPPVRPRPNPPGHLTTQPITWAVFRRDVLNEVLEMDYYTEGSQAKEYYGLVTAVNPEAPPIIAWDGLEGFPRNPVSWYIYIDGSLPRHWDLPYGAWVPVTSVFKSPSAWQSDKFTQYNAVHFSLAGSKDLRSQVHSGLFPEILKSEYHEIRSVMEAYACKTPVTGGPGSANGVLIREKGQGYLMIRVRTRAGWRAYTIDRFE